MSMHPSTSSSPSLMKSALGDYEKSSAHLLSQIRRNEEQRIQLDQKLYSLANIDSRSKQRQQIEHLHSYLSQLDQESQRAKQRNSQLFDDLTQAEHKLGKLRMDAEHLIRLKHHYAHDLESSYSHRQKSLSPTVSATVDNDIYDFNRVRQQSNDGNVRQNVSPTHQTHDVHSPRLMKGHVDHTDSSVFHHVMKDQLHDEHSLSDSTSNALSRSKRGGSLRMELTRSGLYFLLDYIEREFIDTIDKKRFYHHDPPTITQKRSILQIANEQQQQSAIKDLDPATTSMVILDQLSSTIRRTSVHQCLLTEDILSSNIIDLDKDVITRMLPEQDRSLWTRLIDHFTQLLKYHIMTSQTLANKFAPLLLPNNVFSLQEKGKSLLKHIVEKLVEIQQSSSEDETSIDTKHSIEHLVKATTTSSSSWLNKLTSGGGLDDDDDDSTSTISASPVKTNMKSTSSTPRANINGDDSDLEFFS